MQECQAMTIARNDDMMIVTTTKHIVNKMPLLLLAIPMMIVGPMKEHI